MSDDHEVKERKNMMKYGLLEDDVNPMLTETKMWITEDAVSQWAYYQCLKLRDDKFDDNKEIDPELKEMITTSKWAYMYCQHVRDEPDMREKIVESEWVLNYCTQIRDDNEVMGRLTDPVDVQLYFQYKKDKLESSIKIYRSVDDRRKAEEQKEVDEIEALILDESALPEFIEINEGDKTKLKRIRDIISKIRGRKKS